MKPFLKKHIFKIIFTIVGAACGFIYWKYVGCSSGTCPIKSVWYLSTLYGGIMGFLVSSLFNLKTKTTNK